MAKITAVSDSGPLMVLAKLGVLYRVFSIYPTFVITETVYQEVVTSGLVIGARDATEVDKFCRNGEIVIFQSGEIEEVPLDTPSELHQGELETIRLALQISADYLLIDDFDARQVAETNLRNAWKKSAATTLKGTLGVLIELYQRDLVSRSQLKECLGEIKKRKDIWISSRLCQKLIYALEAGDL
jgi:predicted nucleic acid-binding protein